MSNLIIDGYEVSIRPCKWDTIVSSLIQHLVRELMHFLVFPKPVPMGVENRLLEQDNIIDFPLKSRDLSRHTLREQSTGCRHS